MILLLLRHSIVYLNLKTMVCWCYSIIHCNCIHIINYTHNVMLKTISRIFIPPPSWRLSWHSTFRPSAHHRECCPGRRTERFPAKMAPCRSPPSICKHCTFSQETRFEGLSQAEDPSRWQGLVFSCKLRRKYFYSKGAALYLKLVSF